MMRTQIVLATLLLSVALALPLSKGPSELKCKLCHGAFSVLTPLFRTNASIDVIEAVAIPVCERIHGAGNCEGAAPCKDLCIGMVHEFGPEVVTIFLRNGDTGRDELCVLLSMCAAPPPPPSPVPVQGPGLIIQSNLSDTRGETAWPQWQRTSSSSSSVSSIPTFLHITDFHLDAQYKVGTNAQCGEPLCCRERNGPPPAGKRAAGRWGDYSCDTSPQMAASFWELVKGKFALNIDFAIVTGDEPPHDIWMQSKAENTGAIDAVSAGLLQALAGVPTFPCLGNHAAFPVNQYLGLEKDNWLYDDIANDWTHWLPSDALRTLRMGGFYAARARPGLRIIALHTTVLTSDDFWLKINTTAHDFTGQLAWFNDTLHQVRSLNEKAFIIGHARPSDFVEPLKSAFYKLAYDNRDIISGYFFGHSHEAELDLMRLNDAADPFAVAYTAGSVTPFTNLNPGFRVWEYSRERLEITGWQQYWADLAAANKDNNTLDWEQRYHAPDYFGMKDLSPLEWDATARRMVTDADLNTRWNIAVAKGGPKEPEDGRSSACGILGLANCNV